MTSERRRALVLDLHAREDTFVGDPPIGELVAAIEAAGHESELVRSVLARDAGGDVVAWRTLLARRIAGAAYDMIVLTRAWEPELLDALRDAKKPDAKLVRLSTGVRAPLDARFDAVVDVAGAVALLGGAERVDAPAWSKTTARALRERAPLRVLPSPQASQRPTISGPAAGCPYLVDAAKSPHFAHLGLDPARIQTRGCSFCLDNFGAYAVPSEAEVVQTWIAQLERIRSADPAAREVLLTDERPHPFLPAFFRAVEERGLGPVELLVKSRVDWLLEFEAGALREAAALASRTASVLHVYLVGFESFDAFHLELFNKGVSVDDNIRAIDVLRALQAEFPTSFEHRRLRAHGIVLFTPWTRPEHLLENARVMRQVRFDELRAEAVKTRLRLYPRVPLHALAEADGLLVSSFEDGRGDRAAEQGYDASVPWRFADLRTEAIFQVASALAARDRRLSDSDVLEAAVAHVLRWPGIEADPRAAFEPVEQALRLRTKGPRAATLCFDPEVELVAAGRKAACMKEGVPSERAPTLVRAYRAMGLAAGVAATHDLTPARDEHVAGRSLALVVVARDEPSLAAAIAAQRAHSSENRDRAVREMGDLMGYPACCVEAFAAQALRGDNLDNERATFLRAPGAALHPLLHRLGAARLVSHHPCAPNCSASVSIAELVLERLGALDQEAASWARAELVRPVLSLDYARRIVLDGAWREGVFEVTRASALDEPDRLGFDPSSLVRIRLARDHVELELTAGERRRVDARAPLLSVPGEPLAKAALAAIATSNPPPLPAAIRPGVAVLAYRIRSVRAEAGGYAIELISPNHRLRVVARPRSSKADEAPWTLEVAEQGALPDPARAALSMVMRALVRSAVSS